MLGIFLHDDVIVHSKSHIHCHALVRLAHNPSIISTEHDKSVIQIDSEKSFEEACLLEIRLRGGDKLLFTCCYQNPTPSETFEQNNERLNQLIKCISQKKYSHICIVGNLNLKDINCSTWTTVHGEILLKQLSLMLSQPVSTISM